MKTTATTHPLMGDSFSTALPDLPAALLDELRDLGMGCDQRSVRSRQLFEQFRKMLGQERLADCLVGIQTLAVAGEPAGARLLAALLDANTPGSQLLPRIEAFSSVGRLLTLDSDLIGTAFLDDWTARLEETVTDCHARFGEAPQSASDSPPPFLRPPRPLLRRALAGLAPSKPSATPPREDLTLLASLVRLECDAYQERVSRLAGSIDPYRVAAVMRALPLLNRADGEVRDLLQLAAWLEAGDLEAVFQRRIPREFEVLEDAERLRFASALDSDPRLEQLAALHRDFIADPPSLRHLAGLAARLMTLGRAMKQAGLRATDLDLVAAVRLVLSHGGPEQFELALDPALVESLEPVLLAAKRGGSDDLSGFVIHDGKLRLAGPLPGLGDRIWRHDLPNCAETQSDTLDDTSPTSTGEPDQPDQRKDSLKSSPTTAAVKQLVMNNVGSVSILLGFLRNPKVTSIPGLVADVARRTRASRVLEVIAGDRALYSGHANKDVPIALLESPVNISVKTLRRFIHVKFVSKTDLRRLARDKARLRKDVCREIEKYLDSLS